MGLWRIARVVGWLLLAGWSVFVTVALLASGGSVEEPTARKVDGVVEWFEVGKPEPVGPGARSIYVTRVVDMQEGVVCWITYGGQGSAMSCLYRRTGEAAPATERRDSTRYAGPTVGLPATGAP